MKIFAFTVVLVVAALLSALLLAPGCSRDKLVPSPTGPAQTADQAALILQRGLGQGDLAKVWDGLPPAWQADVTKLVQDFAARMDKDVWNRTAATSRKAATVLKNKRDFVLSGGAIGLVLSLDDEQRAPVAYDALVAGLDALTTSAFADLDQLGHFDGRAFAAGPGAQLLASAAKLSELSDEPTLHRWLARGSSSDAKLLADGAERAIVQLSRTDEAPFEQVWVKVDGRWVPQALAEEWPNVLQQARKLIDALSAPETPKLKGALIQALPVVDGFLDRLAAAKTQGEFDGALRGGSLSLGATFAGMMLDAGVQFLGDD